jgi:hypothetical protein
MVACVLINKSKLDFSSSFLNTHYQTSNSLMTEFEMEILVKPNYAQVYNLCRYISVYQYSIDNMYQYSNNIGQKYSWSFNP